MSLPKGYKRLEYIESSGTQYVDTKFVPSVSPRIDIDMTVLGNNDVDVLGTATATAPCWILNFDTDNGGAIYYRYYSASYKSYVFASNTLVGRRANYSVGQNLVIDGTACIAMSSYDFSSFKQTVRLFGGRTYAPVRVYSCRIYNGDTLARDFIPCQNASGAVGLWDAENEVFYGNAGTGTFTAGPVVPEIVDESEIAELEYIQSSGAQYVDTLFKPNQNTRVIMDAEYLGGDVLFCSATTGASGMFGLQYVGGKLYFYYGTLSGTTTGAITTGQKQRFEMNQNAVLLDGVVLKTNSAQSFQCTYSLPVFCINVGGSISYFSSLKLFAFSAYANGLLTRDYIPAKLSNGEIGLYDRVFHAFYRNAGTGEFIAGPEMVHEDYVELEYIESSGTQYVDSRFIANQDSRLTIDFEILSQTTLDYIFGARSASNTKMYELAVQGSAWYSGYGNSNTQPSFNGLNRYFVDKNKNVTTINGVASTATANTFTTAYTVKLFALDNVGTIGFYATMKLYSSQIYDNGTEIRTYIPMLHPSGVAGLWDTVNERFYASATTTDFIAGPEAATAPKSPANFRVESEDGTLVTLAWDPGEDAMGYRLYRQGQLLADITETSVSVTVEPFAGAVFTVTAYNENGEGAGSTLTYFSIPANPILFLITDRTQQDVTERNPKGYYAASDLNRVGYAVEYLAKRLKESGVTVTVSPVLTWTDMDWGTPTAMRAYLADVQTMRGALKLAESTPAVPADMEKLTYTEANQIEMILLALDAHIREMLLTVDAGWAIGLAYTGLYAKEANR